MDARKRGRTPSRSPRVPPRRGDVKRMIFRYFAESIGFWFAESDRPGMGDDHGLGSAVAAGV
ncbi:hypothetical protein QJS10_CPB13g00961 [Acorus calamus]|uniref:Uncharacterized protein n=1 Tax=Acorus calamus TaxID=4465 RepID=A0AAV9DFW3_ACOCL|nr:hypothetical protein QJS10_CPB13g00961 [Acorus calamus]